MIRYWQQFLAYLEPRLRKTDDWVAARVAAMLPMLQNATSKLSQLLPSATDAAPYREAIFRRLKSLASVKLSYKQTVLLMMLLSAAMPLMLLHSMGKLSPLIPKISAFADSNEKPVPRLVTFGPDAQALAGDHDHRQFVELSVPEDAGIFFIRIFDADTGGTHDEALGGDDTTKTQFNLYGGSTKITLSRDATGVVQENIEGTSLGSMVFGVDGNADNRWSTVFRVDPKFGKVNGDMRTFVLAIEGLAGSNGNVFEVALSSTAQSNTAITGARLYSYLPTLQVPGASELVELRFDLPKDAKQLTIENSNTADGNLQSKINYSGRFRSEPLITSGQSKWHHQKVRLAADEPGGATSITASHSGEAPNDITLFAGLAEDGRDAVTRPLPIALPLRTFKPNIRPQLSLRAGQTACKMYSFDASGSTDPDGDPLTYRWSFTRNNPATSPAGDNTSRFTATGAIHEQSFSEAGHYAGRIELDDNTGMIASGFAHDFTFYVKPKPVASVIAPTLVAQGEVVLFDATKSSTISLPNDNHIKRYHWKFGDGSELIQKRGDANFGRPTHRFTRYGTYRVQLTVTDSADNPCNQDTTTHAITVNAPPIANAGGDKRIAVGEALMFDAGSTTDANGDELAVEWDFGNGQKSSDARIEHTYDEPGTYDVKLTLDDGVGAPNSLQSETATVFVNAAPLIEKVKIPETLIVGVPGEFDASEALDPDGEVLSIEWTFGDDIANKKSKFFKSFHNPGIYEVAIAITDNSGLSNATQTRKQTIIVQDIENQSPIAKIGEDKLTTVGKIVSFDGSGSSDPDGSILAYHWDFGDGKSSNRPTPDHVYWKPGTYEATLKVTDNSGKQDGTREASLTVIVANPENTPPEIRVGGDRASFVNEIVEFNATGTTDDNHNLVAIEWDFGDGARASGFSARHAYKEPGEYNVSVLVKDDSGLRDAQSNVGFKVTVTHPFNQAPAYEITSALALKTDKLHSFDASTAIDSDGTITRYLWNFGDGTISERAVTEHSYASPGTYFGTLILTDNSGLPNGISKHPFVVFVTEPQNIEPVAEAGSDMQAIAGQALVFDGRASKDEDGSLIRYVWDFGNGQSAQGLRRRTTYLEPGTYKVTLTVTDNSGKANNTASDTLMVTITNPPNKSPVAAMLDGTSVAIDEPVEFSGRNSKDDDGNILSYDWDFGDGKEGSGRDIIHRYEKSGTYIARLTVRDDSGLGNDIATTTQKIFVNEPPVANAGPDQFVSTTEVFFDASNSVDTDSEIVSYEWDFGDGELGTGKRISHTYRTHGVYEVKLKVTDDTETLRNSDEAKISIVVNAIPVADAGFDQTAAPGEVLTFDGSRSIDPDGSISEYSWNFGDSSIGDGRVVSHAFATPGTYTVKLRVEDDSGHDNASDISTIKVTVNEPPATIAGPDISVSPGEPFKLSGKRSSDNDGRITKWRWDIEGFDRELSGDIVEHTISEPGIYKATLTAQDDSTAANNTAQDSLIVSVNHPPIAEAGVNVTSGSLRAILDASASTDPDNDGLSFSWDFGDGQTAEGMVVEHTYETGGVYPVILTVKDGRGLLNSASTDTVEVEINRPPLAVAGDNRQICLGEVVDFDGSSSRDPDKGLLKYKWAFGDGTTSEIVNPTKVYQKSGSFKVILDVTDESSLDNATQKDEILVSVLPAAMAKAGDDINVCAGETVHFDGAKSSDVDGVVNRFSWDFGDGKTGGSKQPVHTYYQEGRYRVSLQVEGDRVGTCSPISNDDLIVTVRDAPQARISAPHAIAVGEEVTFDGAASFMKRGTISTYTWNFGDNETATGEKVIHAFAEPGIYRVKMRAVSEDNAGGCSSPKAIHTIAVNAAPVADINAASIVEVNSSLFISAAKSSDLDGGIAKYSWNFGDGEIAEGIEVHHTWHKPGLYNMTLTVDDGRGLSNSISKKTMQVEVVKVPNVNIAAQSIACTGAPVSFELTEFTADTTVKPLQWNFGDGTSKRGLPVNHVYERPGEFTVGVTAPIKRAASVIKTPLSHKIFINQSPVAVIEADQNTCPATVLKFDASASLDPDGEITSYVWDFGDGNMGEGKTLDHSFEKPGTYIVKLTVSDDSDSSCSTTEQELEVFVNATPVANAGGNIDVLIGGAKDRTQLNAKLTYDVDDDPLEYYWNLSNGAELEGIKTSVVLQNEGVIEGELTVSDPHGLQCSSSTDTFKINATARAKSKPLAN